ncbi:MAG: hypothetical protein MHM6MM_006130 [Cercozoa sp. M6MM]
MSAKLQDWQEMFANVPPEHVSGVLLRNVGASDAVIAQCLVAAGELQCEAESSSAEETAEECARVALSLLPWKYEFVANSAASSALSRVDWMRTVDGILQQLRQQCANNYPSVVKTLRMIVINAQNNALKRRIHINKFNARMNSFPAAQDFLSLCGFCRNEKFLELMDTQLLPKAMRVLDQELMSIALDSSPRVRRFDPLQLSKTGRRRLIEEPLSPPKPKKLSRSEMADVAERRLRGVASESSSLLTWKQQLCESKDASAWSNTQECRSRELTFNELHLLSQRSVTSDLVSMLNTVRSGMFLEEHPALSALAEKQASKLLSKESLLTPLDASEQLHVLCLQQEALSRLASVALIAVTTAGFDDDNLERQAVFEALFQSPLHRVCLLCPQYTHVGSARALSRADAEYEQRDVCTVFTRAISAIKLSSWMSQ